MISHRVRESSGRDERVAQPQPKYEQRLFVMRDDGVLFGDTIDPQVKALPDLGIALLPWTSRPIVCCGMS